MTDEPNAVSATAAPVPPAPTAGRRRNGLAIAAIVIAVAGLVVAGSVPWWTPLIAAKNGDDQRLAAASAALAAQDTRIARLEARVQQLAAVPDPAPTIAALGDRVGVIERKPDTSAAMSARLDDVENRLTRLAAAQAQGPSSDRMLLLAVEELRGDVARSGPFTGALAATEALARGDDAAMAALAPLEAWGASGIPKRGAPRPPIHRRHRAGDRARRKLPPPRATIGRSASSPSCASWWSFAAPTTAAIPPPRP